MGASPFPYPKWVWSPAGGWFCLPTHWKRNTFFMAAAWGVILTFTFKWSAANERALMPPPDNMFPTPSQNFRKHAAEDDPRLQK